MGRGRARAHHDVGLISHEHAAKIFPRVNMRDANKNSQNVNHLRHDR